MGSSNLTEAGIGFKSTNNVELNIIGQGTQSDYNELKEWFENLWSSEKAHGNKTVDGKKVDFKQYLIKHRFSRQKFSMVINGRYFWWKSNKYYKFR